MSHSFLSMKAFTCLTIVLVLGGSSTRSRAETSVSVNGITFQFDKSYTTGKFVDGQPWVVGPIRVQRITPDYSNGRHGFEINPVSTTNDEQSLDRRVTEMSSRHVWVDPPTLPRSFQPGVSILKVISQVDPEKCYGSCILTSAVLTVLDRIPPAQSFRPPYTGTEKPIFSADLDIGGKLPSLASVPAQISAADALAVFGDGGPWLDHQNAYLSQHIRPISSIRSVGGGKPVQYGADMARVLMAAMLRTFQGSPTEKRQIVLYSVQRGIDFYYMWKNGKSWHADGGHNAGRKPSILYAGYMLQPQLPAITSAMLNLPNDKFQEDQYIYNGVEEALWGYSKCSDDPDPAPNATARDCEGLRDGGMCKIGTACTDAGGVMPTPGEQRQRGVWALGGYQMYTHMYLGGAAIARVLDLVDNWNYPPFFQYTDRLASAPWNGACQGYCNDYVKNMHRAYGARAWEPGGGGTGSTPPPSTLPAAPILLE